VADGSAYTAVVGWGALVLGVPGYGQHEERQVLQRQDRGEAQQYLVVCPARFVAGKEQDMNKNEPFAWVIIEDGLFLVITRREDERDEWVKDGFEARPLYLKDEVPST
jgi:hypothetical protein